MKALDTDDDADMRWVAVDALGKIGDPVAVPALVQMLDTDTDDKVRRWAVWALGKIGDSSAIPALAQAMMACAGGRQRR